MNGSARTLSIDTQVFKSCGISYYGLNDEPGKIVHAIIPEPENLIWCAGEMERLQKEGKSEVKLGYMPDCDGDRGAVVFADGREINRNTLIALLAAIVRQTSPGSVVVTDSCTSDELRSFLEERLGMRQLRFKRGYKNVINKGIELNAAGENCELAIETSGHGAFRENYFSDDGAYIGVKIIIELAKMRRQGKALEDLLEGFSEPEEAIEVRLHITDPEFRSYGAKVLEEFSAFAAKDPRFHIVEPNYEGVRISFDDEEVQGWMLMRQSLHDPVLAMNIESRKAGGCTVIRERIRTFLEGFACLEA
jgi:phosphomannomutase